MERCENAKKVVVFGKHQGDKKAVLFNPRCKSWTCDFCSEQNKADWIEIATRGAIILTSHGYPMQFVTLTSRPYATPTTSLYFFKQNWPKLRKKAATVTKEWEIVTGTEWAYFLVPERHKTGVLHAHVLVTTHLNDVRWWKGAAFASGFGYMASVETLVTPIIAARYVAKYLHKGKGAEEWPKGFRRVRTSQNWPKAQPAPMEGWQWDTYRNLNTVWWEKLALIDLGWHVQDHTQ